MDAPRILIAEDSGTVRKVLVRRLASFNAVILQAENGIEGLDLARKNELDLVITDIDMPGMNGFELCRALKHNKATRHIPVIILSANESDDYIDQGFKVGAAAYIAKVNASQDLIPRIRDILNKTAILRNKRILVVDDSMCIRSVVADGLSETGFRVDLAENGKEAMKYLNQQKPDLIITDMNMPIMSGMALCESIRARTALDDVPILVMSTESDRRMMREIIQKGASGFIVKPFNVDQLVISVEKLLSDHFRLLLHEKQRLAHDRDMLVASISSLIRALEARDHYTRGHSESVAAIAVGIAKKMNFSQEEIEDLVLCARLHDIGKIGIRDDILLKPGLLTKEEFTIIQQHPKKGVEILKPIPSMAGIIPGILQHHEKIDGSGYPLGLSGDSIHPWARIIAVADVFHALTSRRPYRDSMPLGNALAIIHESKGSHLCPDCVVLFLQMVEEGSSFARDPRLIELPGDCASTDKSKKGGERKSWIPAKSMRE